LDDAAQVWWQLLRQTGRSRNQQQTNQNANHPHERSAAKGLRRTAAHSSKIKESYHEIVSCRPGQTHQVALRRRARGLLLIRRTFVTSDRLGYLSSPGGLACEPRVHARREE
jgi:hypothetical protein